jgi:hypothetical protein
MTPSGRRCSSASGIAVRVNDSRPPNSCHCSTWPGVGLPSSLICWSMGWARISSRMCSRGCDRVQSIALTHLPMAMGCTGARDEDGIPMPVRDGPRCSKDNAGAVATAGGSSTMTTASREIIARGIAAMHALPTCRHSMDTARKRKRGSMETTSRQGCVTSIRIRRSGGGESLMRRSGAAGGGAIRLSTGTQ